MQELCWEKKLVDAKFIDVKEAFEDVLKINLGERMIKLKVDGNLIW